MDAMQAARKSTRTDFRGTADAPQVLCDRARARVGGTVHDIAPRAGKAGAGTSVIQDFRDVVDLLRRHPFDA
ncbi:MAG: hypothetical protein ACRET1_09235, partial [Burkholderiales bacterium]